MAYVLSLHGASPTPRCAAALGVGHLHWMSVLDTPTDQVLNAFAEGLTPACAVAQGLEGLRKALQADAPGARGRPESGTAAPQLTPLQMKRIREACQAQSHVIAAMLRKMNVLEAAVAQEVS